MIAAAPKPRGLPNAGKLKVVDHPDLRDPAKVAGMLRGLDEILETEGPPAPADESRVFKALHACAHAASNPKAAGGAARQRWCRRYERILAYLVRANLGLVYEMVRRAKGSLRDDDVLLSEALWCLFQAVRGFDPWRGQRFSTYACTAILRGLRAASKREGQRQRNWRRMIDGVDANRVGWTLDAPPPPEIHHFARALVSSVPALTTIERSVIEYRYLQPSSRKPATLDAVGRFMNLSRERVRQIQNQAIDKLRGAVLDNPGILGQFGFAADTPGVSTGIPPVSANPLSFLKAG